MTDLPMQPIQKTSVVDAAFDQLRSRILRRSFLPGEKLPPEHELARTLGVSRSTIREALNRLASARLIRIQHGGSKTVLDYFEHAGLEVVPALITGSAMDVDPNIIRSVTELRSTIAPDVVRLAALKRNEDDIAEIMASANAMLDQDQSLDELTAGSVRFWKSLILASQNLAYRLAFNSLMVTYVPSANQMRQIIETELRAGSLYLTIAKEVKARHSRRAAKATEKLVALGADAIFSALDLFEQLQAKPTKRRAP